MTVVLFFFVLSLLGVGCPIRLLTGISCAGCGLTRAYKALLQLDVAGAFYYHPLFFLVPVAGGVMLTKKRMPRGIYKGVILTIIAAFVIVYIIRLFSADGSVVVFEPENNIVFKAVHWIKTVLGG